MFKTKKYDRPAIRRRPVPKNMAKQVFKMNNIVDTGLLLEFSYGRKQKPGEVGGYKNDPRPLLLVFHDDGIKYIEGLNTHYISLLYIRKLNSILNKYPGIKENTNGKLFYEIVKKTAYPAVKKGYRKYLRDNARRTFIYVQN